MPSACFKCVNKLAFLQSLLFVSKHLWFWGIFEGEEGVFGGEASGVACEGAVGAYHAVAWDEDADCEIFVELCHGLLQHTGGLGFERGVHQACKAMHVALGAWHFAPVAKA